MLLFLLEKYTVYIVALIFASSCGDSKQHQNKRAAVAIPHSNDVKKKNPAKKKTMTSEEAYKLTLYPLLKANCGGCHGRMVSPFFASDDIKSAHQAIIGGDKVNFDKPEDSRVYQRLLADQHHCWSGDCSDDGNEVLVLIYDWIKLLEENKSEDKNTTFITDPLSFSDATKSTNTELTDTYIWEAENFSSIEAPMQIIQNEAASQGKSVGVPQGNGGTLELNVNNNVGFIDYEIDIKQAGSYKLYGRLRTPNVNSSALYFSIDGGAFNLWASGVANNNFVWNEAAINGATRTAFTINLNAGLHTIRMRRRSENAQFDMFALSSNRSFNGGMANIGNESKQLEYDLNNLVGMDAKFRFTIDKFDDFSWIIKKPEIILSSGRLYVKSIYLLINGNRNSQAATYSVVDTEVSAPGAVLSEATLIQPFVDDPELDEIQVVFEMLEKR